MTLIKHLDLSNPSRGVNDICLLQNGCSIAIYIAIYYTYLRNDECFRNTTAQGATVGLLCAAVIASYTAFWTLDASFQNVHSFVV